MKNQTPNLDILQLEGFKITPESSVTAFILLLVIYVFIMLSDLGLVILIWTDRSLHQPMYLLFCNMIINDAFGASAILPHVLSNMFTPFAERYIYYSNCVLQAFCAHFHATTSYTVLMIMAYDRYIAICNPLRYATIMTGRKVGKLTAWAWGIPLFIIVILIGLNVRLSRCRRVIMNPFCDNASLFKLSCENVLVNHIYGLLTAAGMLGCSICSVIVTYFRIFTVCLSSKNQTLNSRALQTCSTHLAVYIILLLSGLIIVSLHRFPHLTDHRKIASILLHVIPPALNSIIYGLQIKALRQKIFILFTGKKDTNCHLKSSEKTTR